MDPYRVLGVSTSATEEEIKQAYRNLVKKYHPDKHRGTAFEKEATEKLKEINEAYDMLKNRERNGSYSRTGAQGTGQAYSDGRYTGSYAGGNNVNYAQMFAQIRQMMAYGKYREAELILRGINVRTAEWYFLMGNVSWFKGWQLEARNYYQQAVDLEPNNEEYLSALERCQSNNYTRGGYSEPRYNDSGTLDDLCRCCTYLSFANCCCECMGGRMCC